jgi:hypothetical protein
LPAGLVVSDSRSFLCSALTTSFTRSGFARTNTQIAYMVPHIKSLIPISSTPVHEFADEHNESEHLYRVVSSIAVRGREGIARTVNPVSF